MFLIITQKNVPDNYGQSILYDNEDMLKEEVEINSQEYMVLTHKSGWTEIVWFKERKPIDMGWQPLVQSRRRKSAVTIYFRLIKGSPEGAGAPCQ